MSAVVTCLTFACVVPQAIQLFHSVVQRVMGYAARDQHDQHVTWVLSVAGNRRDMFTSSFEILVFVAQPEDLDDDELLHECNDAHETSVSDEALQRLLVFASEPFSLLDCLFERTRGNNLMYNQQCFSRDIC